MSRLFGAFVSRREFREFVDVNGAGGGMQIASFVDVDFRTCWMYDWRVLCIYSDRDGNGV